MWRSVPQIDAASTLTRISPGPGLGEGTSRRRAPGSGAILRRARMVAGISPTSAGSAARRSLPSGSRPTGVYSCSSSGLMARADAGDSLAQGDPAGSALELPVDVALVV